MTYQIENQHLQVEWWQVVCAMAEYIGYGYEEEDLEEGFVRATLEQQGFSKVSIEKALDWLAEASLSGNISEVFSMLQPVGQAVRVASPLEKVCVSEKLWHQLENFKHRGIISPDLVEKLLEGIRSLDTRDWEDEEIHSFIMDVISSSMPHTSNEQLERLLKGLGSEFYS